MNIILKLVIRKKKDDKRKKKIEEIELRYFRIFLLNDCEFF